MFTLYGVNTRARIRGFFPLIVSGIAASVALAGDTVWTYQPQNATSPENQIIDRSNTLTLSRNISSRDPRQQRKRALRKKCPHLCTNGGESGIRTHDTRFARIRP